MVERYVVVGFYAKSGLFSTLFSAPSSEDALVRLETEVEAELRPGLTNVMIYDREIAHGVVKYGSVQAPVKPVAKVRWS